MYNQYREGFVEVITGCMFAGKTEELIRRIKVLQYANKNIQVFKPQINNHDNNSQVISHAGQAINSIVVKRAVEILDYLTPESEIVVIDDAHFFDQDILYICDALAKRGLRVMVAGLDTDFRGEPFGVMPALLATAEFVTKLAAICTQCGAPATRTYRKINGEPAKYSDPIILLGAKESYEARCRHCHDVADQPQFTKLSQ